MRGKTLLVALVLLRSLSSAAQQGGTIMGQLRVAGGYFPSGRIEVRLESRGGLVGSTYANSEGSFYFSDLPPNSYHVIVSDPGYQPAQKDVVLSPLSVQNAFVQFNLVPKDKPKEETYGPIGGNPYMVDLAEYTRTYPKPAIKVFKSGLKAQEQGRDEEALNDFKKAVNLAPDFYAARNNLGSAYLKVGNFPAAAEQFSNVIRIKPGDAAAYFNLGNVYLLTKRYPDAQASVQEGLKKQPNAALGRFLLGTIYARTGKPHEAERMLNDALAADPTMSNVYLELVNLYLQQKMQPQAIAELKTFLAQFPHDALAPTARKVLDRLQASGAASR